MKNRLNNILIGLLWLLAIALGATFWFNTKYGFNIFSIQHWQYLSYMQATNQPVRASFYISLLIIVIVAVFGLYQLLQPRFRRIILPIFDGTTAKPHQTISSVPASKPVPSETIQNQVQDSEQTEKSEPTPVRPPRLNIPTPPRASAPVPYVQLSRTPARNFDPEQEHADIHEIFTSAGFVYKGSPRIKGTQTSVIAIGTNEVLWIGATGISDADMQRAVDTLHGVFSDTLDDIEININAFIIDATDGSANDSIMHFATVDDLRSYIDAHPNIAPDADEIENFDAYSGYIGTVIDYIGKI